MMFGIIHPVLNGKYPMFFRFGLFLGAYSATGDLIGEIILDQTADRNYWPIKHTEGCTIEVAVRVWRV